MRLLIKHRRFKCLTLVITAGLYLSFSQKHNEIMKFIDELQSPVSSGYVINMTLLDLKMNSLARRDVQTTTSWGAPILWNGTFDSTLFDEEHKMAASSVAATVFAVGKYLEVYLENFLVSAEKHFMPGLAVTYFVFTDQPEAVPTVKLGPLRDLRVLKVEKHQRWQDISMLRMKTISDVIQSELHLKFSHLFCFDVDQVFKGRWGSEALGESVAQIHSGYYKTGVFTYDRNPKSKAYLPQGDFYYHAAIFGGSLQKVKELVDFCYSGIMEDKANQVEALWHDESHLNKYFYLHKPSRVLSPEYCWSPGNGNRGEDVHVRRLEWAPKYYDKLRQP